MKALDYIKNKPQKSLFIGFLVLFGVTFLSLLFPGFNISMNNWNAADPQLKYIPICGIFYRIHSYIDTSYSIISIIFLIICFGYTLSTIITYLAKKKVLPFSPIFISFIIIRAIYVYLGSTVAFYTGASFISAADVFVFIFSLLAIIIDIIRLVRYVKTHPRSPRPPRSHKPTDKERIAELEKRVQELESKD